ncbi:N-lysine methyltransferase SMYD2-B isoform X2 [Folsomia candida]|uniref:N-lysine methyltransferase SMYD2-B isoform X2 n=1 Tax=Folsomia candida TaxID=158441 RepID=UPI001604FAA3|nr:N-lysine methyltransferase SMYD2-B isoform X2 [Folsomia candida]
MNYDFPLHHYSDYENIEKHSSVVKPGTVLLTCKPFAYSLSPNLNEIRCNTCFKLEGKSGGCEGLILLRCGGCQQVRFCNRECQRQGWNDGHKYECKGFGLQKRVAGSFTRLLIRIIVKLQKNSDYYDEVSRRKVRRRFKDLVSHFADLKTDKTRMEQVEAMSHIARSVLLHHPEIKFPNETELLGICGRIFVNTFSITDYENHTIGIGLYIGASVFDHSCQPLAVANFDSTDIIIRNIREFPITLPILKVTISYRDVIKPTEIRKAELLKCYYFECQCERCSTFLFDNTMQSVVCPNKCDVEINLKLHQECPKCKYKFEEDYIQKVADAEEAAKMKITEMGDTAYLDVAEVYIRILTSLHFSEIHWLLTEMYGVGFDSCIDTQRWECAYQYGTMALKDITCSSLTCLWD